MDALLSRTLSHSLRGFYALDRSTLVVGLYILLSRRLNRQQTMRSDEYTRITAHGERLLPECRSKYTGSVWHNKAHNKWLVRFGVKYSHLRSASFDSEDEATRYIKEMNVEHDLPIRNMIYRYEGEYYCDVSGHQLLKFSLASRPLIESRVWTIQRRARPGLVTYYDAVAHVTLEDLDGTHHKKTYTFRRMMFPYLDDDQCVRCRNGDHLDGTIENIYVVPRDTIKYDNLSYNHPVPK